MDQTKQPIADAQDFRKYQERGAYHWTSMRPSWKISFDPYLHARYSVASRLVPAPAQPGQVAVDLGCGDGYFSGQLASLGYTVHGIDGNRVAIEHAQAITGGLEYKQRAHFRVGNVYDTQLPARSADVVTCLDVIEHLDHPKKLLEEIVRIGKPGAAVLIGTPVRFTHKPFDKYHVQEFFTDEFRALVEEFFPVAQVHRTHPVEWLALLYRKTKFFGRTKHLHWNLLNLYVLLTGRNPFAQEDPAFPTYQFAVGKLR